MNGKLMTLQARNQRQFVCVCMPYVCSIDRTANTTPSWH